MKLTYIMAAVAVISMSTSAFAGGMMEGKGARCQINGVVLMAKTADECKTAGGTALARPHLPGKKTESTESTESSE